MDLAGRPEHYGGKTKATIPMARYSSDPQSVAGMYQLQVESQVLTAQDLGWKFDSHLDARIYEQFDKMKTQVTDPAVVDHVKNFLSQLCPKQGWHEEIYTTCGDIAKRLDCKTFKNPQGHVIGAAPLAKIGDYGDKKKDKVTHIMKTASARAGNARTLGRK